VAFRILSFNPRVYFFALFPTYLDIFTEEEIKTSISPGATPIKAINFIVASSETIVKSDIINLIKFQDDISIIFAKFVKSIHSPFMFGLKVCGAVIRANRSFINSGHYYRVAPPTGFKHLDGFGEFYPKWRVLDVELRWTLGSSAQRPDRPFCKSTINPLLFREAHISRSIVKSIRRKIN